MLVTTATALFASFVLSITALFVFIWTLRRRGPQAGADAALTIFADGEIGFGEDPAHPRGEHADPPANPADLSLAWRLPQEVARRVAADRSSAAVVLLCLGSAVAWLLLASAAGLFSSIKLHQPDLMAQAPWLGFGRIRTVHLNAVAYGWAPLAAFGVALWMLPRLAQTTLRGARYAAAGALLWNLALAVGLTCIAAGVSDGLEWLEIPWPVDVLFVIAGALVALPLFATLRARSTPHLYVSLWYMGAALCWFPLLFLVGNLPALQGGVAQATMNWWYGHNVLGLFYTPMALAAIYYFLPKLIGQPIQSYDLSLLGFWTLAFFYGQVGGHHLIGGPVPGWLVTLSIVQSVMMLIPVAAFTLNQHLTLRGHGAALRRSPTLRFIVLGGAMYTLSSVQGAIEALRSVNTVTHFTHVTVAHAHLGLYGFFSMVMFGAIYFVMPRATGRNWPYPWLIAAHFWLVVLGFAVYVVGLSIGGWLQGRAMLDAARPFMDSVDVTVPYLKARSLGGALMTLGHLVFAAHFLAVAHAPARAKAA